MPRPPGRRRRKPRRAAPSRGARRRRAPAAPPPAACSTPTGEPGTDRCGRCAASAPSASAQVSMTRGLLPDPVPSGRVRGLREELRPPEPGSTQKAATRSHPSEHRSTDTEAAPLEILRWSTSSPLGPNSHGSSARARTKLFTEIFHSSGFPERRTSHSFSRTRSAGPHGVTPTPTTLPSPPLPFTSALERTKHQAIQTKPPPARGVTKITHRRGSGGRYPVLTTSTAPRGTPNTAPSEAEPGGAAKRVTHTEGTHEMKRNPNSTPLDRQERENGEHEHH